VFHSRELLEKLREYLREPRSRAELQKFCGISSRDYFRNNILKPLIASKKINPTKPDKPTSSKQKYVWNDN
jgi:ATP-dependent DNA helicase RecG